MGLTSIKVGLDTDHNAGYLYDGQEVSGTIEGERFTGCIYLGDCEPGASSMYQTITVFQNLRSGHNSHLGEKRGFKGGWGFNVLPSRDGFSARVVLDGYFGTRLVEDSPDSYITAKDGSRVRHGDYIYGSIEGKVCYGRLYMTKSSLTMYFCQDMTSGSSAPNKYEFKYSWAFNNCSTPGEFSDAVVIFKAVTPEQARGVAGDEHFITLPNGDKIRHGDYVKASISSQVMTGRICIDHNGGRHKYFLCQNYEDGSPAVTRFEYQYSWIFSLKENFHRTGECTSGVVLHEKLGSSSTVSGYTISADAIPVPGDHTAIFLGRKRKLLPISTLD